MKEIEVAAKWWADQLRGPAKQDNGDAMHSVMMSVLARQQAPIEPEKITKFESALAEILLAEASERSQDNPWIARPLDVDYGADKRLRDAAAIAKIDPEFRFPVKTCMWIEKGKVTVSCGYRAPTETLYEAST